MRSRNKWTVLLSGVTACLLAGDVAQPPNRGKARRSGRGGRRRRGRTRARASAGSAARRIRAPGRRLAAGPSARRTRENLASLKKSDPELYKVMKKESDLDRRINAVAKKYRGASKAQQDKIK